MFSHHKLKKNILIFWNISIFLCQILHLLNKKQPVTDSCVFYFIQQEGGMDLTWKMQSAQFSFLFLACSILSHVNKKT
jgi:hypothetical protein